MYVIHSWPRLCFMIEGQRRKAHPQILQRDVLAVPVLPCRLSLAAACSRPLWSAPARWLRRLAERVAALLGGRCGRRSCEAAVCWVLHAGGERVRDPPIKYLRASSIRQRVAISSIQPT